MNNEEVGKPKEHLLKKYEQLMKRKAEARENNISLTLLLLNMLMS
jgi:hypothetical protein